MIYLYKAIDLLSDGKPHNIKFVTKGDKSRKREGGYEVYMRDCVLLSTNNERQRIKVKSNISGQIRWVYFVLLIEIDNIETFI